MVRSNPLKGKNDRNNAESKDNYLEGTSARTRSYSFDDIMLARKNKADATKEIVSGPEVNDIALSQDGKTSPECHKQTEDSGSKGNKHVVEDSQKPNSLGKGNVDTSRENRRLVPDKGKDSVELYPKLKSVVDKNISNNRMSEVKDVRRRHYVKAKPTRERDGFLSDHSDSGTDQRQSRGSVRKEKGSKTSRGKFEMDKKQHDDDRQVSRKRKTVGRTTSDSGYKKRNERDMTLKDKLTDRSRDKSEKEVRHKHHNQDDRTRARSTGEKLGSEKKGVELPRAYHGESRSKRRQSQSREHAKERGGKSPSPSPKSHQHRSKDKKEHGELLPNSNKDRSGKELSDVDKRISSNGSSNQYKRNAASSSGLGGYSPRKRKTDAGAKTPSPTRRSPARRTAGWDLQPVEKESANAGSSFSDIHTSQNVSMNVQESPVATPVAPIVIKPIGLSHHTISSQMHAIESIQLTQATRPMRRLYVENLPALVSEKDLIDCINKYLLSSGVNYIQGTQPCISCIIHKEKGQALLEFLTPEDASAALSFDGISFSGSNLKLRRPKDYATISTGVPDKSVIAVDSISDHVEDSPHKIFIGGISKFISSKMLLEIARAFGSVKAFRYEFIAGINEPCAFLEYVDHSVTSKACAGLNGMRLGGKVVTAVCATPNAIMEVVGNTPFYGIPDHAKPLLENPSAVLKLTNVLDPQGLLFLSESELEEILEDIKIECSRFGTVKSLNVVKPTNAPATMEAEMQTMNASIDGGSEAEKLVERINEVAVLEQSEPPKTVNASEGNCQVGENNNDCDNSIGVSAEPEDANRSKLVGNSLPDEMNADNLAKDEACEPPSDDANASINDSSSQENTGGAEELPSQQISSAIEVERNDDTGGPISPTNIEMEEKCRSDIKLKLQENTKEGNFVPPESHPDNIFEPGCILVEYRRAEAGCMAAHCLHGRMFDGQVVTVAYVNPSLYHMRFHK